MSLAALMKTMGRPTDRAAKPTRTRRRAGNKGVGGVVRRCVLSGLLAAGWRWVAGAAVVAFVRSYVFRLGGQRGAMGFAVGTTQAYVTIGKCFALYRLNQNDRSNI